MLVYVSVWEGLGKRTTEKPDQSHASAFTKKHHPVTIRSFRFTHPSALTIHLDHPLDHPLDRLTIRSSKKC